jgi:hypothetical protein
VFSTFSTAEEERRSAPFIGQDQWYHEGFDCAILLMLVAHAPSELMHEAKDGAHLISHPGGVQLTDASHGSLTRGTSLIIVPISPLSFGQGLGSRCFREVLKLIDRKHDAEHCSLLYMFLCDVLVYRSHQVSCKSRRSIFSGNFR